MADSDNKDSPTAGGDDAGTQKAYAAASKDRAAPTRPGTADKPEAEKATAPQSAKPVTPPKAAGAPSALDEALEAAVSKAPEPAEKVSLASSAAPQALTSSGSDAPAAKHAEQAPKPEPLTGQKVSAKTAAPGRSAAPQPGAGKPVKANAAAKKTPQPNPPMAKASAPKPIKRKPSMPAPALKASKPVAQPDAKPAVGAKRPVPPRPAPQSAAVQSKLANTNKALQEPLKMTEMMNAEALTSSFQNTMSEMTARAKTAYQKSAEMMNEASAFAKGNVEAMVESSKILASGMQDLGRTAVADSRSEFETLTADVKNLAGVKTPTDFFQLQSAMMRKHFDKAVAMSSKNSEAMLKLYNDAFQPISNRVSLAMEKANVA